MYYYRLLHPQASYDDLSRARRPIIHGPDGQRIYQLPVERRPTRQSGRR